MLLNKFASVTRTLRHIEHISWYCNISHFYRQILFLFFYFFVAKITRSCNEITAMERVLISYLHKIDDTTD